MIPVLLVSPQSKILLHDAPLPPQPKDAVVTACICFPNAMMTYPSSSTHWEPLFDSVLLLSSNVWSAQKSIICVLVLMLFYLHFIRLHVIYLFTAYLNDIVNENIP